MAGNKMREVDTETPVVWPAWCYSGEASVEASLQQLHHQQSAAASNSLASAVSAVRNKGKRKATSSLSMYPLTSHHLHTHLDKMLTDRMANLVESQKKFGDRNSPAGLFYGGKPSKAPAAATNAGAATAADLSMDYSAKLNGEAHHNNNNHHSNNNNSPSQAIAGHIKSERLSPVELTTTSTTIKNGGDGAGHSARSRSATPSPYPGTPPQQQHQPHHQQSTQPPSQLHLYPQHQHHQQHHNQQQLLQQQQHHQNASEINQPTSKAGEFQPRNYSDFIRSLAAKYNNTNPNEANNARNLFEPPRFAQQSSTSAKSTKESPSPPECKRLPPTPPQVPCQNSIMSSIFPGIPFPPTVFSPLIDMSSTQALMTLARAAKEADLQNLLKVPTNSKRPHHEVNLHSSLLSPHSLTPNSHHHQQRLHSTPASSRFSSQPFSGLHISSVQSLNNTSNHHSQNSSPARIPSAHHDSQTSGTTSTPSFSPQHSFGASASLSKLQSSTAAVGATTSGAAAANASPLDLSSSTPVSKRLKLESPSPNSHHSVGSPPTTEGGHSSAHREQSRSRSSCKTPTSASGNLTSSGASGGAVTAGAASAVTASTAGSRTPKCHAQMDEINAWSVAQVCDFVAAIDICVEYTENFREQQIDGSGLPLLTEDHLMHSLGMKLGPALKLRSVLAKRLDGPCSCGTCCTMSIDATSPAGSIAEPSSVDSNT